MISLDQYGDEDTCMSYIEKNNLLDKDSYKKYMEDFTFYEFELEELGLPSAEELLQSTLDVEKEIGLYDWTTLKHSYNDYRGFSLTYNKNYVGEKDVYSQTLGSKITSQIYGFSNEDKPVEVVKNTYYDTLAFNQIQPLIYKKFGKLFNKINCAVARSRISYLYPAYTKLPDTAGIHVDEWPFYLMRINIPLKTNENHILQSLGEDPLGNSLHFEKHLEVGKCYIWNTKIPHQVTICNETDDPEPRIHIVLGVVPWFNFDNETNSYIPNENYKKPIKQIVEERLFIQS